MRVLLAPDSFGGSLTAAEAATAMAEGWARSEPKDTAVLLPLADGGTGFVEVLHTARGGTRHEVEVTGPLGTPTSATWLELDGTAYLESASACGLHLVDERTPRTAASATSRGVGELMAAAAGHGPRASGWRSIVVGLGGSACTDGGAGMLAALGAVARDADGDALPDGGGALARAARLDGLADVRARFEGVDLVVAADVDHVLTGPEGAAAVFGPQKGADEETVAALDAALTTWAAVLGDGLADLPGAGAAGGLGVALAALGARRVAGGELVREVAGLDEALARADLVVTGEGRLDAQSLHGKLVSVVAARAREQGVPCIALAGQVDMSTGEALEAGLEGVYSVAADAGSVEAALAEPAARLADLAEGVAKRWGARPPG